MSGTKKMNCGSPTPLDLTVQSVSTTNEEQHGRIFTTSLSDNLTVVFDFFWSIAHQFGTDVVFISQLTGIVF